MLIGVTGGIGAGKSAVCKLFAAWGAAVIDADAEAHRLLDDAGVRAALVDAFGPAVRRGDGSIDRRTLGALAFAGPRQYQALQRIVRPVLARRLWAEAVHQQARHPRVVIDAALLLEWGSERRFDRIVLVEAAEQVRVSRVQARTGLPPEQIRQRMAFQVPPESGHGSADFVIDNSGDQRCLWRQARRVWRRLVAADTGAGQALAPKGGWSDMGAAEQVHTHPDCFVDRHVGPRQGEIEAMLAALGLGSLEEMVDRAVPAGIRQRTPLGLAEGCSETEVTGQLRELAARNQVFCSYLGMGYADCVTPPVIQRAILENPGWYTHYTPYQAEVAQGRLEALLNYQTMVADLTGMELANASLLDEATAAAEAVSLLAALRGQGAPKRFLVSSDCHPQTAAVVRTRARWRDWEVLVDDHRRVDVSDGFFGVLLQYPASDGQVDEGLAAYAERAHAAGARVAVAADLLALCVLTPPGEWGADVVVGSTQRFGLPMGCGGPHAAYLATRSDYRRQLPGRIIGVSTDAQGAVALRMALQTREQHIRREKATSNICTAQVLPAVVASMYAVYHGPDGLRRIAAHVHHRARQVAAGAARLGLEVVHQAFFDTVRLRPGPGLLAGIQARARQARVNLRYLANGDVAIAVDETTDARRVERLLSVLAPAGRTAFGLDELELTAAAAAWPESLSRRSAYLSHEVFSRYHSETDMLRYMSGLQSRDLSLATAMIPLGSCTMKLNGAVEMQPITWPEFGRVHPFAPAVQAAGYQQVFAELRAMVAAITGLPAVCLQPNSGAQGEFAGLLVIRTWHASRNQAHRDVCLIPASAHGTNPASAVMAGMQVVVVNCDARGDIDLEDLRAKASRHADRLAAIMVTYPSTHGVFEEGIVEVCAVAHRHGGQVYLDGANMNALVGLCRPAELGVDVCHLNLHKTFAIPHGGGGPGMGPIAAAAHLEPFLPVHPLAEVAGADVTGPVAAAPWGSALVLLISWAYMKLLGAAGLRRATVVAILNANYVAQRLEAHYPVLFRGGSGLVAHEAILDLRHLKASAGVTAEDVAKRLMDYGFHAPTISFPVAGTLMVEPTESESRPELERFCAAMIAIREEIAQVERGEVRLADSPLTHAPHTAAMVCAERWELPYSRRQAALPAPWLDAGKFWPAVARVDNAQGDRQLVCVRPAAAGR